MKFILSFLLCVLSVQLQAATYYVAKSGSDSADGSEATPWLTITKASTVLVAGDTVIIGNGDYNEQIDQTVTGTVGNYITYQAQVKGQASLRAFRIRVPYIKLDGLKIDRYSGVNNTWGAAVRIETAANKTIITNCTFRDLPYVIAHDFTFNVADKSVNSASSNFVTAGFVPNSKVYLGATGLAHPTLGAQYFANHDTTWEVDTVTATKMTLKNGSATFLTDTGTNWWAFIRAGSGNSGFPAILAVETSSVGPSEVTITNNTIDNWASHAINITGDFFTIENNKATALKSFRFLSFSGSGHRIRNNLIKDCPNILHYTETEIDDYIPHPPGTGWYDYQVAMMSGFEGDGTETDVLIENNWFQNIENQIGRVDDSSAGITGITYNRNVFIGVSAHFSGGRDNMKWTNNTFYKCAWGSAGHPLSIGGLLADAHTNYEVTGNVFVACGAQGVTETATRGFYSIADWVTGETVNNNFVASEELTGYAAKTNFSEVSGVNGGDPVFYSVTDFLGPDGEPFTDDDGLQVLPTSAAAGIGGGALGVYSVVTDKPLANFRVTTPTGWFEPTGEDYDPQWLFKLPTTRGGEQRPFDVPVALGEAPVGVIFNASKSISGVGGATTNTAITNYSWNFGDGTPVVDTALTTVSHSFGSFGDYTVRLTVTNTAGNTHSYSQVYRVLGVPTTPGDYLRVPSQYATIQAAVNAADAGDVVFIAPGVYNENVTTVRNGTAANKITIDGQGAQLNRFYLANEHHVIKNLVMKGNIVENSQLLWMRRGAHYNLVQDCVIDSQYAEGVFGINWEGGGANEASDNVFDRITVQNCFGTVMVSMSGNRNTLKNSVIQDGKKVDFMRLFGSYNLIKKNLFQNNIDTPEETGWHPDIIQTFGNNGEVSHDHIIEQNVFRNAPVAQMSQLSGTGMEDIRDWTFRNNIYAYVGLSGSCTMPGVKYYNNVFYRCSYLAEGQVLNFGSRKHDRFDLWKAHPLYPLCEFPTLSGFIATGSFYNVEVPEIPSGGIVNGIEYKVRTRGSDKIIYDGVDYVNNEIITGNGVTTYTAVGDTAQVYLNGTVTYNGVAYGRDVAFEGVGVTTYTKSHPEVQVYMNVINRSHNSSVKNNVFLECGGAINNTNGWYSFGEELTGVSADYNYVAKHGLLPVRNMSPSVPVGGPGDWGRKGWYEPNGINAGDPGMVDFSNLDFRLLETSILRDAGTNIASITNDIQDTPRPLGGVMDIGPYEFTDDYTPPPPPPPPDTDVPPFTPGNLALVAVGPHAVIISWVDASTNESGFELARSTDNVSWTTIKTLAANIQATSDAGLEPSQLYYYRIRAFNGFGRSAWIVKSVTTPTVITTVTPRRPRASSTGTVPP